MTTSTGNTAPGWSERRDAALRRFDGRPVEKLGEVEVWCRRAVSAKAACSVDHALTMFHAARDGGRETLPHLSPQRTPMWDGPDFRGAKIALIVGTSLIAYQRDDKPDIPFPGLWDLPGGGREDGESPVTCALREVEEEFGLTLDPGCIVAMTYYPAHTAGTLGSYFLVGSVSPEIIAAIRFGSEGQRWALMSFDAFMAHPEVIPHFKTRLNAYLAGQDEVDASAPASTQRTRIPGIGA